MRISKICICSILYLFAFQAMASDQQLLEKCLGISDPTKRIECYDNIAKSPTKKTTNKKLNAAERERMASEVAAKEAIEKERKAAEEEHLAAEKAQAEKLSKEKERHAKAISAAKDVLKSLKKLETRVETGVSYRDYPSVLSDAKFEVKTFLGSEYSKELPEFTTAVTRAIEHFDAALSLWSHKFEGGRVRDYIMPLWDREKAVVEDLFSDYPSLRRTAWDGKGLYIDPALSVIWGAASKKIQKSTSLLQDAEK